MSLVGQYKHYVKDIAPTMSAQTFKECLLQINATYHQDQNVFKRQNLENLSLSQTYTLVYKALVGGTTKVSL